MNKAKCLKCQDTIESLDTHDYKVCRCGNASVVGGLESPRVWARDFLTVSNIDDEGNTVCQEPKKQEKKEDNEPSKESVIAHCMNRLDNMLFRFETLPDGAGTSPVYVREFYELLVILSSIFRAS
jgi:hypothetical protein